MKKSTLETEVKNAWWALERVAGHLDLLGKCVAESLRVEKEHRAMGKRFTGGRNRYTLSAEWAARYFVCKHVAEVIEVPKTWREFDGYRADVAMCQALREELLADAKRDVGGVLAKGGTFAEIDYAGDIALPC